jgi:hypothetical protein
VPPKLQVGVEINNVAKILLFFLSTQEIVLPMYEHAVWVYEVGIK